jgi:hypothetical protein
LQSLGYLQVHSHFLFAQVAALPCYTCPCSRFNTVCALNLCKIFMTCMCVVNSCTRLSLFSTSLVEWTTGVRSPTEAEDFSSSLCVQTGSGAHAASCPMGTEGPFPGDKARPGRDADHSPPSSAEVKYK